MSHQYSKYAGQTSGREQEPASRRRQARESQPPIMNNYSAFDKTPTTPTELLKSKQPQTFDQTTRTNNKFVVQANDQQKPMQKSTVGSRTNEPTTNINISKKEEQQPTATQQSLRTIASSRFMSPQVKNVPNSGHRPQERKYSNHVSESSYNSRSIQQLPSNNELTYHRSNTEVNQGSQGKLGGHLGVNNQSAPVLPKKAPRFSEPANFSMDNWEQGVDNDSTSHNTSSPGQQKKQHPSKQSPVVKEQHQKASQPLIMPKTNNFTTSAFKKDKELKETVSTQSTFHPIEDPKPPINRLDSKGSQQSMKKSSQPLKLSDFRIGKEIGSGKFGSVFLVQHKLTRFVCAMKKIPKDIIKEENILNQLIRELKIQMFLDHPNIIKLYGFFHDKEAIYLLLELGSSGQLYKVIKERERMSESSTSYTIKQVCEAVRYLHFFKIIHRDLKPENIVIQSVQHEFTQGTVKLCDFGWAVCRGTELRSTFCGTPLYVSPEILKGQLYDEKIDLWAIGILTYELLFGTIPFEINREEELVKIIKEEIVFPQNIPVSEEAKDFVLRILKKNPGDRLKIGELLEHDFLKKCPELAPELENC